MGLRVSDSGSKSSHDGPPSPKCEPASRIVDWLKLLVSGPLVEMRAVKVSRAGSTALHTERALYPTDADGLARLARDARAISPRAQGVYVTLNPLRADLEGSAADADVTGLRWLFIDIDAVRPADASTTEHERQLTWFVGNDVRDWLAERGFPQPIFAESGNCCHLLYRVDLAVEDAGLIARVLAALADRFDSENVVIDRKVFNPSRICRLYGTLARKGAPTMERPHRASMVCEAVHPMDVVSRELLESVAAMAPVEAVKPARPTQTPAAKKRRSFILRDLGPDPVEAFVATALEAEVDKVASTPNGHRNHQLFSSAAALWELVNTGRLAEAEAEGRLRDAARRSGLDDAEIETTLRSARKKTEGKARDISHVGNKVGRPPTKSVVDPITGLREAVDDPHRLAREYLRARGKHPDGPTIRSWNDEWHVWRRGAWSVVTEKEIRAALTRVVRREFERHALTVDKDVKGVGTRLVANVANALADVVLTPLLDVPEMPAWLECDGPNPSECLNCRNGVVHLPTLVDLGPEAALTPQTPRFFTANALDYDFDPNAPEPSRWLAFLDSIWPDDPEAIEALQQWFGYLLTPDTSQQKILLMIGPPRSGKGTIGRLLTKLLGASNVTAPTLTTLGGRFGSQSLIGKSAALCGESRIAGRTDSQAIVERLLSISGEDPQSIERKNAQNWTGRLTTRFVLFANELPRLGDYSDALPSRLIVLKLSRSFQGREDLSLDEAVQAELPGILLWSIQGWQRLREAGRFTQPASGLADVKEFKDVNNPIGLFIADRCEIGADLVAPKGKLYEAWKAWCVENGRDHPGTPQALSSRIKTSLAGVSVQLEDVTPYIGNVRTRAFKGIGLSGGTAAY